MEVGVGAHVANNFRGNDVADVGTPDTRSASFENIDVNDDNNGGLFTPTGDFAFRVGVGEGDQGVGWFCSVVRSSPGVSAPPMWDRALRRMTRVERRAASPLMRVMPSPVLFRLR